MGHVRYTFGSRPGDCQIAAGWRGARCLRVFTNLWMKISDACSTDVRPRPVALRSHCSTAVEGGGEMGASALKQACNGRRRNRCEPTRFETSALRQPVARTAQRDPGQVLRKWRMTAGSCSPSRRGNTESENLWTIQASGHLEPVGHDWPMLPTGPKWPR